jgi:hypothetical protein
MFKWLEKNFTIFENYVGKEEALQRALENNSLDAIAYQTPLFPVTPQDERTYELEQDHPNYDFPERKTEEE